MSEFKNFASTFKLDGEPFFNQNEKISFGRSSGRLDVMGGIADYSGSLVLEMPIVEETLTAVQFTPEPLIQIVSFRNGRYQPPHTFSMALAEFGTPHQPISYPKANRIFQKEPERSWAAYIAGVIIVLIREKGIVFHQGLRILIQSAVPEGKGVSSSAAVEVATMRAILKTIQIELDPIEVAFLCQKVENEVAGAPCGIMDQMTVVNGRSNKLLVLLCQPAIIQGFVDIPPELAFWGIDSGIRHAVSGADYGSVRVGAFMGLKILQTIAQKSWNGYLANIAPSEFEQLYREQLPVTLKGADFLEQYGELPDAVTAVDPNHVYAVRQPTAHPIYEHFRVKTFAQLLRGDALANGRLLGELMYQSHASYSACGLGSDGTDLLVELVRSAGKKNKLYGAKISGGGSGGTVIVLGHWDAEASIAKIAKQYEAARGYKPTIFRNSNKTE